MPGFQCFSPAARRILFSVRDGRISRSVQAPVQAGKSPVGRGQTARIRFRYAAHCRRALPFRAFSPPLWFRVPARRDTCETTDFWVGGVALSSARVTTHFFLRDINERKSRETVHYAPTRCFTRPSVARVDRAKFLPERLASRRLGSYRRFPPINASQSVFRTRDR